MFRFIKLGAKGKPLDEETKKKISEALRKRYGTKDESSDKRSAAGQAYLDRFVSKRVDYEDVKAQRDDLIAQAKKLGRTKKTAAARKEIRKQIAELTKQMKQQHEVMRTIKSEATGERRKKNAEIYVKKAEARVGQYNALITKVSDLLAKTEDPDRRVRLQAQLNRALNGKVGLEKRIGSAQDIAAGKIDAKKSTVFDFHEYLEDRSFSPIRDLTLQEERVDVEKLNEFFNDNEGRLSDQMIALTIDELERVAKQSKDKLDARDIAAIAGIAFLFRDKIKNILRSSIKESYNKGKTMAAIEMGLSREGLLTPLLDTQLMNLDADDIAESYVASLENTAKSALKAGVAADASIDGTISAMTAKVKDEASKMITNISGTIVGQYMNRGRDMVFGSNLTKIISFQRSEVLDGRTCATCLSLDKRVIKPDDPMRELETVHTHCRGFWVPIFDNDATKPDVTGIPKTVTDSFDLIDGRPIVNAFKNLKKPINDVSKEAQSEIRKRLK